MASKEKNIILQDSFQLSYQNTWLLWFCQLVNILSLSAGISGWMLAMLALCLCWQASLNYKKSVSTNKIKISPTLLTLLAVSGCITIAISAGTHGVLISMVHLLSFAYMLKAFEINQRKDFYQLSLLGLFILGSALIFEQNLIFSLFILIALILNLLVLLQVFTPKKSLVASVKTIIILLVQSSIFAIILFIVFPRLSPFWEVPSANAAQTGLSDEVSPGDIANLALSNKLAFRVDFKGEEIPSYSNLYWRAMTLENYDGRKWTRVKNKDKAISLQNSFTPLTSGDGITYDVIVEPSYQFWLLALSVATSDDPNVHLINDYTIKSRTLLSQTSHYVVESYLQAPLDLTISNNRKQRNLAIVNGSNPRLEALGLSLIEKFPEPIARSNAVLNFFREQAYFYTLESPLLTNNSLDQFFFDTKAGFCVHYASAYTYLMRAAGIPARIVTGYLGGEYNGVNSVNNSDNENTLIKSKQNGHLSIYQRDAHAWSEIWLEGVGWQRVDPTAAVDPQRVESGWSTTLLNQQSSLGSDLLGLYQMKNIAWLNTLRLQFDALDYQWTRLVLGYSNEKQLNLLTHWFGDNIKLKAVIGIIASFIIIMLLFSLINSFNIEYFKRNKSPLPIKLYQQILQRLSNKGLTKSIDMTPTSFAQIVAKQYPEISQDFIHFTQIFERLMYQKTLTNNQQEKIKTLKEQHSKIIQELQKLKKKRYNKD
jgi:transglutaminase-like putative cysteine protease